MADYSTPRDGAQRPGCTALQLHPSSVQVRWEAHPESSNLPHCQPRHARKPVKEASDVTHIRSAWQTLIACTAKKRLSAVDLLSLMSFFNLNSVPISTLRRYRQQIVAGKSVGENDSDLRDDLNILRNHSLIEINPTEEDSCNVHVLVHSWTQRWLSSHGKLQYWQQEFLNLMALDFPTGEDENLVKCTQLLPHIRPLFAIVPVTGTGIAAWAQILTNAAWYLWSIGKVAEGEHIAVKALAAREALYGRHHYYTLMSVTILAVILNEQGRYQEAESLAWRAVEGYEMKYGPYQPDTLASVNILALMLRQQGQYHQAEKLHRRTLALYKKQLGARHHDTLISTFCLARALHSLGGYKEAAKLYRKACDGFDELTGSDNPISCQCRTSLLSLDKRARQHKHHWHVDVLDKLAGWKILDLCKARPLQRVRERLERS